MTTIESVLGIDEEQSILISQTIFDMFETRISNTEMMKDILNKYKGNELLLAIYLFGIMAGIDVAVNPTEVEE